MVFFSPKKFEASVHSDISFKNINGEFFAYGDNAVIQEITNLFNSRENTNPLMPKEGLNVGDIIGDGVSDTAGEAVRTRVVEYLNRKSSGRFRVKNSELLIDYDNNYIQIYFKIELLENNEFETLKLEIQKNGTFTFSRI